MKKNIITLFLALASVINLHAAITYEHNLNTRQGIQYDMTENNLNTYAFGLESVLSEDASILNVTYRLNNSNATSVNVLVYYGEEVVATVAGGTTIGKNTVALATANLPKGVRLTWGVEVNGTSVEVPTQEAKTYSFYYPSGLDIDNNPENATFGMLLINECLHHVKDIAEGYVSSNYGAGIYAFAPSFDPIPNGNQPGYNGGIEFTTTRADGTGTAYAPRRIRISEDGRIFVTSLNTDGNYLWEVNPANMNEWTTVFSGELNENKELVDAEGNFVAAPNTGFDVKGAGENLQLAMYSVNLPGITSAAMNGFRLHEYNLGTATEWATAPSKTIVDGLYAINSTGTQVEYDNEGGVWIASYRGVASDANPGLVHINADGVEDAKLIWNNVRQAGIRFNNDFTKLVVAGNNGAAMKATIYSVSKDENGAPVLTEEIVIDMAVIGKNLNDFAWDYAGNLYSCSNSAEKLAAWAMPYSGTVVTPAAAEYAFQIGEPVEMVGVVKRAVQLGESTIVLTHETDSTPHIYNVIDGVVVAEISQEGVIARDPENAGDYLAISDIAVTEDGKLVATNYMQTQSTDDYVDAGYKRGETRIYIWNDLAGDPSILFTSKMSSNWFRSKHGLTMAVKGTSDNMEIFMTGIHPTSAWARVSSYRVIDGVYVEPEVNHNDHYYFYDINDAIALETTVGTQYELNASPLGDMNWVLDAELINPTEITEPEANWVEIATSVALTEDLGKKFNGATYVTVGEQVLMVAPYAHEVSGLLAGVKVLDITAGLDAATVVATSELDIYQNATAAATAVAVNDNTLTITLVADATIHTLTAKVGNDGPVYEVYEDEITNLVIDLDNLILIGGPSTNFQVDVFLGLGEYNMSEDSYQLHPESSIAVMGSDATFIEGYAYEVDAFTPSAKAVVRCKWQGIMLEFHLTMTAAPMENTITYELNGGITNDYGWMSKNDMFQACMEDAYGYDIGISLNEFKQDNNPYIYLLSTLEFNVSHCQNILDNARWDWLEEYLITIQEEDQLAVPLTKGVASKDWRYAIAAFFFESQYDTSSDYSQAGTDEAYIPYWKHGYDNPTQPTQEWVLNAPYKENYLFDGWYATKTFTDEPITTVNASTNGTLYAKWKNEIVSSDTVGICFYDTYYWDINDEIYDRTGTYYATDEEGKHVLHLTVYPLTEDVEIFDTIRAGEIYDFEGRELTQTGTYYEAMLDDNGCDYTITLHLTVVHEEYVNICQGETYTWAVNSQIYSETGTYNLTTNDGIFILHLTVNPLIYTEETITTCDSYQWNGQTYTQSGDYTYTTTATNGCDSTITLHLTINQTQYAEETITACDSYTWNGQTYTQSGDYTYSTTAINGCDSIATLHLLVYQSKHKEEYITACDNYEWNGQTYTESGTYTHTSTTIDGCDSIVTLHLTINYSEVGETENVTICHGETYTWNGQTYSTAGEYSVTLSNTNGCDSAATLHLTIMPQAQEEVQYETINKKETPFIWQKNGKKYYETTTDSIFIPYTHHDCDSMIYILDLTVVDIEDVRAEYDTICESALPYEWHGQSITTGGRYEYTEKYGDTNIDILHVLYLTVIPTIRTQQSATICYEETFAWNGNTYSQTGTYTYTTEAANGCDSVVTLYLTVLPPAITIYTDTMIAHVDLPYIWRGQYCDTSGEYTATIPFAANTACDSVIYVLNLTVESVNKCGADLSWEYDNGILTISGSGAMYDNPDLQSYRHESWYPYRVRQVILSDQLTHIGNIAFADCANLTNIDIPSSVTSIGDGAFSWTGLLSVTIPASVTELGEQVFETCNNLHTILYEGTPSSISNQTVHPFIGCVHLDTIITPAELWHCTSADPVLENRYGVPHKARYIEVTDGFLTKQAMKYIAKNASTLKVLDLTYATNTTLPYGVLSDSYQLSTLYLPQQIEVIPESMIEGGRNLTEILIPATVTEIGNHAFAGCTNVWRMTVEAILPPKVYANTFDGIDRSISLIVPAGSEDLYRQAEYWREFFIEHTNSPSPITHCQKLLREDHILILREGKVYTTMGQLINVGE